MAFPLPVIGVVAVSYTVAACAGHRHGAAVAEAVVGVGCAEAGTFVFALQATRAIVHIGGYAVVVVDFGALVAVRVVGVGGCFAAQTERSSSLF